MSANVPGDDIEIGNYDYIQASKPTDPSIGDDWLDVSDNPPIKKVYVDLGDGGQWSSGLLDTPVSSRSSHDWDPQGRIDAPISSAGKGVDWGVLTPQRTKGSATSGTVLSVSGSGYLFSADLDLEAYDGAELYLDLDGTTLVTLSSSGSAVSKNLHGHIWRFDTSLELTRSSEGAVYGTGEVSYALD